MGACRRASLLAGVVAMGCGGRSAGDAADAAARAACAGLEAAADLRVPRDDVGVASEAGAVDATISDAGTMPEASATDGDATSDAFLGSEAGSDAGCVPTTCEPLGATCGLIADGCGGIVDCGSCPNEQTCGGGGPNRCGPSSTPGDGGRCGTGTVTLRLDPGPGGPWGVSSSGDEEPNWLAIFTASGTPLYQNPSESANVDCNCARDYGFPIGYGDSELTDAGTSQSWDGFYFEFGQFTDAGACPSLGLNSGRGACLLPACAPPGQYVAYMCACAGYPPPVNTSVPWSSGIPSGYAYSVADCPHPTCVAVPFEYASQTLAVGTVSESD